MHKRHVSRLHGIEIGCKVASGKTLHHHGGRSVIVNPVANTPTLTVSPAQGPANSAIPLSISSALVDTDGSETLSAITISGIPIGATLSNSGGIFYTASAGNTSHLFTSGEMSLLSSLKITPPLNDDTDFNLTVSVTSTDTNCCGWSHWI